MVLKTKIKHMKSYGIDYIYIYTYLKCFNVFILNSYIPLCAQHSMCSDEGNGHGAYSLGDRDRQLIDK